MQRKEEGKQGETTEAKTTAPKTRGESSKRKAHLPNLRVSATRKKIQGFREGTEKEGEKLHHKSEPAKKPTTEERDDSNLPPKKREVSNAKSKRPVGFDS